jgi:hypothetical protein
VSDEPIALLERELVSAARRRAAAGPVPDVVPWPRARRRRIRVGDALSAAAAAGAVIVALAALALLGSGGGGHPASTAAATPRDQLLATLAVLRRPQTTADRSLPVLSSTAPWGAKVFLVPMVNHGESLSVRGGPGGPGNDRRGFTATDIAEGRAVVDEAGFGRARHPFRFLVVVPDGVTIVRVVFDEPHPLRPGSQALQLVAEGPVQGNVASLQALGVKPSRPWVMVWLNAQHKAIKRIALPTDLG